jgi:hypothetical protein
MEVVQRLLLDRIDAKAARPAVRRQDDLPVLALPDEAETALALVQAAKPRAEVALHPAVVETVPVLGGNGGC